MPMVFDILFTIFWCLIVLVLMTTFIGVCIKPDKPRVMDCWDRDE